VLKLKTHDFRILTRTQTLPAPPASAQELAQMALALRERVGQDPATLYRLVGVGLGNFREPDDPLLQPDLFQRNPR
jgi:DNA polymerase IV